MNPYRAPTRGDTAVASLSIPTPELVRTDIKVIIRAWERLRILYNLLLFPLGLIILYQAWTVGFVFTEIAFGALTVGFGANAFFFFGPLFEIYACSSRDIPEFGQYRLIPFLLGLVISLILFLFGYMLVGYSGPNMIGFP